MLCGWKLNKINDANTKHWVFFIFTIPISNTKKSKSNSTIRVDWLHQRLTADSIQIQTMWSKQTTKNYKCLLFFFGKKINIENVFKMHSTKCYAAEFQINVIQIVRLYQFQLIGSLLSSTIVFNWLFSHSLHIASIKSQFFFLYLLMWLTVNGVNTDCQFPHFNILCIFNQKRNVKYSNWNKYSRCLHFNGHTKDTLDNIICLQNAKCMRHFGKVETRKCPKKWMLKVAQNHH